MRSNIRLLSSSDKVQDLLAAIHYQSQIEGEDELTIVVEYGRCSHNKDYLLNHNFTESGPECFKTEVVIPIDVQANRANPEELLYREFPWIPLPFTICMLFFIKLRGKAREILIQEDVTYDVTSKTSAQVIWKEHYDTATGFYYYQNLEDGEVTWEPPLHEEYIPHNPEEDK